ncbi:MAG: hypothetical protein ACU0BF_09155 [Paracoccaceae bacterium]
MFDTPSKSPLASRTVWGGIAAIVAGGVGLLGYTMTPDDAAQLTQALTSIGAGVGGILAIYGRVKATKRVTIGG